MAKRHNKRINVDFPLRCASFHASYARRYVCNKTIYMRPKKLSKDDRLLIYYLRYSLIFGSLSAIAIFSIVIFESNISFFTGILVFAVLLSAIPGYLILPGILYRTFLTGMTFTEDQMIYYTFTILTLGIGPALIYFIRFNPTLKEMLREK